MYNFFFYLSSAFGNLLTEAAGAVVSPEQQWPCSKSLGMNNSLITSLPITVSLHCVEKKEKVGFDKATSRGVLLIF